VVAVVIPRDTSRRPNRDSPLAIRESESQTQPAPHRSSPLKLVSGDCTEIPFRTVPLKAMSVMMLPASVSPVLSNLL